MIISSGGVNKIMEVSINNVRFDVEEYIYEQVNYKYKLNIMKGRRR